jgi:hypothetical protein
MVVYTHSIDGKGNCLVNRSQGIGTQQRGAQTTQAPATPSRKRAAACWSSKQSTRKKKKKIKRHLQVNGTAIVRYLM